MSAAEHGDVPTLKKLLDSGRSPNENFIGGGSPLELACFNAQLPAVRLLLARGADPNYTSKFGGTPVGALAAKGSNEGVRLLIAHGARLTTKWRGLTPLQLALKNHHPDTAKILIDAMRKKAASGQ